MGNYNRDDRPRNYGRRDSGGRGHRDGPREMHKAVCDGCNKDCEVPFRPTGSKPIYCRDCFNKKGGGDSRRSHDRGSQRPRYDDRGPRRPRYDDRGPQRPRQGGDIGALSKQFEELNRKLDKLIEVLTPAPPTEEEILEKKKSTISKALKKVKKPKKKKAPAKKK